MRRRAFLGTLPLGPLALGGPSPRPASPAARRTASPAPAADERAGWQRLHPDAQTDLPGAEYFFLGNGHLAVVVQHATGAAFEAGQTPLGLMFWDPEHFARKWSAYPFHPEWGLKRGMVTVRAGTAAFTPEPATLTVRRESVGEVPVVVAAWAAGPHRVEERFWMTADAPVLVREVAVTNGGPVAVPVAVTTTLYYAHALFTDYATDHAAGTLRASGYAHANLTSDPRPTVRDRFLTATLGPVAPSATATARLTYTAGAARDAGTAAAAGAVPRDARWAAAERAARDHATVETGEAAYDHLFRAARDGMRAAVSRTGRFDASIWQYNLEWVMDATGVVGAACATGQHALAASVLDHVCTHLVDARGVCAHASRFHDDPSTELNQQGALLGAAWTYHAWTGDLARIRRHWPVLQRVAAFALDPRFLHPSGLVQATIEFFERDASSGLLPGFDVTHQSLVAWGLEKAALLARIVGDDASAARWAAAGARMREAFLAHPTLSLVDDGVLVKRRLPDGRRQTTLVPPTASADHVPAGTPLASAVAPAFDPDIGTLWPLLLGQVDPESTLGRRTLDAVAPLWNEAAGGGYLRYNPAGDPDAPGSWTFPTAVVGRVMARAGRAADVRRVLDWFTGVQGARGGAYFEFYARTPRPVPPLPPMGVIVWGWAEIAALFVEGVVGARLSDAGSTLTFRPCLPDGLDRFASALRFRDARLDVTARRTGRTRATLDGRALPATPEGFALPTPVRSGRIALEC